MQVLSTSIAQSKPGCVHCNLETEWNSDDTGWLTGVYPPPPSRLCDKILVLDLAQIDCFIEERYPKPLQNLLETPKPVFLGVNVSVDMARPSESKVDVNTRMEKGKAWQAQQWHNDGHRLQKLCSTGPGHSRGGPFGYGAGLGVK